MPTDILEVGTAPHRLQERVELLVVGGPTHAFGMSRPGRERTRPDKPEGTSSPKRIGMREWLTTLERTPGSHGAAFDTRIAKPRVPGSAARAAEKRFRKLGFRVAVASESFYVTGTAGPLVEGEEERAGQWGESSARM